LDMGLYFSGDERRVQFSSVVAVPAPACRFSSSSLCS